MRNATSDVGQPGGGDGLAGQPQQHRRGVPGQRQGGRTITGEHHLPAGHPLGQRLGRVGEHFAAGAVAQRLGVEFVGQGGKIGLQRRIDGLQRGQPGRQIAAQPEFVRRPQPRLQHRGAPGGGVAQRSLVRRRDDDPRTAAHRRRRGGHQCRIPGVVAGDDENVERADPGRRFGGHHDRLTRDPAQRGGQHRARALGRSAAGHPDHGSRPVAAGHLRQLAFVDRGRGGTNLRTGHRRRPQQSVAVGFQQTLGVVEVDGGVCGAHVASFG